MPILERNGEPRHVAQDDTAVDLSRRSRGLPRRRPLATASRLVEAAVIAAVPIGMGLALSVRIRWGWLAATWGLITGFIWLVAVLMGFLDRGYGFSFAGWAVGIAMATYIYLAKPPRRPGRPSEERVHRFTGQAIGAPGQKGRCNAVRSGDVLMGMAAAIWIVLAVLSNDPVMRWLFVATAGLVALSAVLGLWEQRKRSNRSSEASDESYVVPA